MARIRYVKPEFFLDEDLADHPIWVRYLFEGLWCQADRDGRLDDRPRFLKTQIFPFDDVDVEDGLSQLSKAKSSGNPFILRYVVDGKRYIQILEFQRHQNFHRDEKPRGIPAPPMPEHDRHGTSTVPAPCLPGASTTGTGTGTGTGTENKNTNPAAPDGAGVPASPDGVKATTKRTKRKIKKISEFSDTAHRLLAWYSAKVRDDPSCKAGALDWIERRLEEGHSEHDLGDAMAQYADQVVAEQRPFDKRKNCRNFFGEDRIFMGFPARKAVAS